MQWIKDNVVVVAAAMVIIAVGFLMWATPAPYVAVPAESLESWWDPTSWGIDESVAAATDQANRVGELAAARAAMIGLLGLAAAAGIGWVSFKTSDKKSLGRDEQFVGRLESIAGQVRKFGDRGQLAPEPETTGVTNTTVDTPNNPNGERPGGEEAVRRQVEMANAPGA